LSDVVAPASQGTIAPKVGLVLKIAAGAAIPAIATLIFNLLNFFVDNYRDPNPPKVAESTFDFAVGCAFAILGICFGADKETTLKLVVLLVSLILATLAGDVLYLMLHWNRLGLIIAVNALSLLGLAWAIAKAG
jgi:hypothetical protein